MKLPSSIKSPAIFLGLTLFLARCEQAPDPNYGESKTTITLRALPGMQVYPNGTKMGVYRIGGVSGNRTYTLIDSLVFPPLGTNEDANEASFTYKGQHPVWLRIEPTSSPPISPPLKYQSPFETGVVDFWVDEPGLGFINLSYRPNFWIELAIFSTQNRSDIPGGGRFQLGDQFSLLTQVALIVDRALIGDTATQGVRENYLPNNASYPLLLEGGAADGSDSLLYNLEFEDIYPHDTTYVFYDYDKDSLHVSKR